MGSVLYFTARLGLPVRISQNLFLYYLSFSHKKIDLIFLRAPEKETLNPTHWTSITRKLTPSRLKNWERNVTRAHYIWWQANYSGTFQGVQMVFEFNLKGLILQNGTGGTGWSMINGGGESHWHHWRPLYIPPNKIYILSIQQEDLTICM